MINGLLLLMVSVCCCCRAVEGDEVAVLPFKLKDWFVVYKEREKVGRGLQNRPDARCAKRLPVPMSRTVLLIQDC
jgi:hypothetical protein